MTPPPASSPPTPPVIADLPFSAAAQRNAAPILAVLQQWLPAHARVLEIASGTGQHAQHVGTAQPGWDWQPTEAQAAALPVLAARGAGLPGVRRPLLLDVLQQPWPVEPAGFDAVFAANLLHISPWAVTPAFFRGAAACLAPGGSVVVYGPFAVEGEPLAASNAAFDADLRARDPRWGLRVLQKVALAAQDAGLRLAERRTMPAHNLMLRFEVAG